MKKKVGRQTQTPIEEYKRPVSSNMHEQEDDSGSAQKGIKGKINFNLKPINKQIK